MGFLGINALRWLACHISKCGRVRKLHSKFRGIDCRLWSPSGFRLAAVEPQLSRKRHGVISTVEWCMESWTKLKELVCGKPKTADTALG